MAKSNKSVEDSSRDISATTYRPLVDAEHAEAGNGADSGLELGTLCEQVREQTDNILLSLVSADTDQEKQKQILALQSIADTITRFCAAYTYTAEMEAKTEQVEVEGQSATSSRELSTETKEEEEEMISGAEYDEEVFARYRAGWERMHGDTKTSFEDLTLISPMLFTHYTPGFKPVDARTASTMQVCSIKVTELENFSWPLQVYGVVAARDAVDQRRNPIFLCPRHGCQIIEESYPFLPLTGPVRAIFSEEPVDIEFQLTVKGTTESEDRQLVSYAFYYEGDGYDRVRTCTIENHSCIIELRTQNLTSSVQATIFGVHVVEHKSMPFEYGFKVVCASLYQSATENINESPPSLEVVLFDSKDQRKRGVKDGFINLSRQVLSVGIRGKLKVLIQAYAQSRDIAAEGHVLVVPKRCNTSQHELDLGGFKIVFTVAWSLMVEDEELISMNGMVDPFSLLPPMHPTLL